MSNTQAIPSAREYLWFALLLIVVLSTTAVRSSGPETMAARVSTPDGANGP